LKIYMPQIEELQNDERQKGGYLFKLGRLNNVKFQKRYFVLRKETLYYYVLPSDAKPKGTVTPISSFQVWEGLNDAKKQQYHFSLVPAVPDFKRTFKLYAETKAEKEEWMTILQLVRKDKIQADQPNIPKERASSTSTGKGNPERKMFDVFENKPFLPWDEFVAALEDAIQSKLDPLVRKQLRYCLELDEKVPKVRWIQFISWFSPLSVSMQNDIVISQNACGWEIEQIADILEMPCFFGFIDLEETNEILRVHEGGFIIRFSSKPRFFSLSVQSQGNIAHWRIEIKKTLLREVPKFILCNAEFASLYSLIEEYKVNVLPQPEDMPTQQFVLVMPIDRQTRMPCT